MAPKVAITMVGDQASVPVSDNHEVNDTSLGLEATPKMHDEQPMDSFAERETIPIGRADNVYNRKTRQFHLHKSKLRGVGANRWTKYVIVVRREFDEKGIFTHTELEIRGEKLRQVLDDIHRHDQRFAFRTEPAELEPRVMFHSFRGLQDRLNVERGRGAQADEGLAFELEAGISYIQADFGATMSALDFLLPRRISWDLLWCIFPNGTVVVGKDKLGQDQAYIVRKGKEYKDPETGLWYYRIFADYIDYDGTNCGWVEDVMLFIEKFSDVEDILGLPYWPMKMHSDAAAVEARFREAGRDARKRHGMQVVEYTGHGLRKEQGSHPWKNIDKLVRFNVGLLSASLLFSKRADDPEPHGRLVLDPRGFNLMCPRETTVPKVKPVPHGTIDDEMLVLMSASVYGFSLGDKMWGTFTAKHTQDANWNAAAFDTLEADQELKGFVESLVRQHVTNEEKVFDDVIQGKGEGLVGLLEGPPGVGKTLTAEAIAEVTQRPLYSIGAGELGEKPSYIHQALRSILERTQRWNAVLLLDEADVFLAERNDENIQRNAIISIFLRELEYYSGIMILTTNRLRSFDPAFESRIHFCLEYVELDPDRRFKIWQRFLDIAQRHPKLKVDIGPEHVRELADLELNGRQIKNVVSISQAVALQQQVPLSISSIRMAIKLSRSNRNVITS